MYARSNVPAVTHSVLTSPSVAIAGSTPWAPSCGASQPPSPSTSTAVALGPGTASGAAPVQAAAASQPQLPPATLVSAPPHPTQTACADSSQVSSTTATLVAAVGPLFEAFVAQTQAVVADPSISLQRLTGSITQDLAAAIASAAVQLVASRRQ